MKASFKMSVLAASVLMSLSVNASPSQKPGNNTNTLINNSSIGQQLSTEGVRTFNKWEGPATNASTKNGSEEAASVKVKDSKNKDSKSTTADANSQNNDASNIFGTSTTNKNSGASGTTVTGTTVTGASGGGTLTGGSPITNGGLAPLLTGTTGIAGNIPNIISCFNPPCQMGPAVTMGGVHASEEGMDWARLLQIAAPIVASVSGNEDFVKLASIAGSGAAVYSQMELNPDGTRNWSSLINNPDGTTNWQSVANLTNVGIQVGAAVNDDNADWQRAADISLAGTSIWNMYSATRPTTGQPQTNQGMQKVGYDKNGAPVFQPVQRPTTAQPRTNQGMQKVGYDKNGAPVFQPVQRPTTAQPQTTTPTQPARPSVQPPASTGSTYSNAWQGVATMFPAIGTIVGGETGQWLNVMGSGAALYNNGIINEAGELTGSGVMNITNLAVQGAALTGSKTAAKAGLWTGAAATAVNAAVSVQKYPGTPGGQTSSTTQTMQKVGYDINGAPIIQTAQRPATGQPQTTDQTSRTITNANQTSRPIAIDKQSGNTIYPSDVNFVSSSTLATTDRELYEANKNAPPDVIVIRATTTFRPLISDPTSETRIYGPPRHTTELLEMRRQPRE